MKIKISEMEIRSRKRPLNENAVASLAESIKAVGLLQPITVTEDRRLVGGLHRLEAHKLLGLEWIEASIVSLPELDLELAEIDENLIRNELTALERGEHLLRRKEIYEVRHPETKWGGSPGRAGGGKKARDADSASLDFVEDTSAKTGHGARTICEDVQIAADLPIELRDRIRLSPLADQKTELLRLARIKDKNEQSRVLDMILDGEAKHVLRAMNFLVAEKIRREPMPMPDGEFRVIVIDPPWRYTKRVQDPSHTVNLPYPDMSIEEICAEPVASKAHEDCILWLWTTNAFMREAFQCLDAWGFEHKTILTWVKPGGGLGDWLLGRTEHCLLAKRGSPRVFLTNQDTVLFAPRREHSRKPEEFYILVDSLCPGSKLEWFARESRSGWSTYGAERGKFDAT